MPVAASADLIDRVGRDIASLAPPPPATQQPRDHDDDDATATSDEDLITEATPLARLRPDPHRTSSSLNAGSPIARGPRPQTHLIRLITFMIVLIFATLAIIVDRDRRVPYRYPWVRTLQPHLEFERPQRCSPAPRTASYNRPLAVIDPPEDVLTLRLPMDDRVIGELVIERVRDYSSPHDSELPPLIIDSHVHSSSHAPPHLLLMRDGGGGGRHQQRGDLFEVAVVHSHGPDDGPRGWCAVVSIRVRIQPTAPFTAVKIERAGHILVRYEDVGPRNSFLHLHVE